MLALLATIHFEGKGKYKSENTKGFCFLFLISWTSWPSEKIRLHSLLLALTASASAKLHQCGDVIWWKMKQETFRWGKGKITLT